MTPQELERLQQKILANQDLQQATYEIDGTRYVIECSNTASPDRWMLWMYRFDAFADFVAADSLEDLFRRAKEEKGVPIEKLTLDQWHS